ncbi:MAG: hypothetical protein LC679_16960 [Intrasporangiaceae bacterium]|nr:hypothetical protein [Intrasporangiaceae bacterium]
MRTRNSRHLLVKGLGEPFLVLAGLYLRDRVGLDAEAWVPRIEPPVDVDPDCQMVRPEASLWSRWWLERLQTEDEDDATLASPLGDLRAASSAWETVCDQLGDEPLRAVSGYRFVGTGSLRHDPGLEYQTLKRFRLPDGAVPGRDQLRLVVLPVRGLRARRGNVLITGASDRHDATQHQAWLERELADHEQRLRLRGSR